jgi:DNA-binding transcriptional LysR family regulator
MAETRNHLMGIAQLKARARDLAGGLEPEVSIVVNILYPTKILTCAVAAFQTEFPNTPLRISVEGLGAVIDLVQEGRCAFGIGGPLPMFPLDFSTEHLLVVDYRTVAARHHPLASYREPIPASILSEHVQLVLSDRSSRTEGEDFGVLSPKTWRLYDLGAKHAFLLAGLGWGGMPFDLVEADHARGDLVTLVPEEIGAASRPIPMFAFYRQDAPPGPAGRWLLERLKRPSGLSLSDNSGEPSRSSNKADGAHAGVTGAGSQRRA